MNILKRIWPALVVGALWLVFLALRLAMSDGSADVSTTPQFYEYHRPAVEEKLPAKEPHLLMKEARKVQSLSAAPLSRPVQPEKLAELTVSTPIASAPTISSPIAAEPTISSPLEGEAGRGAPVHPTAIVSPVVETTPAQTVVVPVAHTADSQMSNGATSSASIAGEPSPAPIPLDELPQAVNRTIKGAMLTIELDPPAGTGRDEFLQSLGARSVSELQLSDSDIIRKYEMSGQVYVFKLSGGGRVLLPPMLLARIISAIEAKTGGDLLYRGRILLGPQGRIIVKEAVKL